MASEKQMLALLRAAVDRYQMIHADDRVAVGVSGGKDSLALLTLLAALRKFYPIPFTLTAITLDLQFNGKAGDFSQIQQLCERLDVPYVVRKTDIFDTVFRQKQEKNPCSLCARLRRGTLHKEAAELGCNVVALGHHRDDAAQTVLMNLLCGGTLDCFAPKCTLDRCGLTLIRPMIFMAQAQVEGFAKKQQLPIVTSACPVNGQTERARTEQLLRQLREQYGPVEQKILHALQKSGIHGWGETK